LLASLLAELCNRHSSIHLRNGKHDFVSRSHRTASKSSILHLELFEHAVRDRPGRSDTSGRTRAALDPLLRQVAMEGPWVSAHPDVILKMGVKDVLNRTRHLGWGADTHRYDSASVFRSEFPQRLRAGGPRVIKQNRGNGGQGVWKVEDLADTDTTVRVLHAQPGSRPEEIPLDTFIAGCEPYFGWGGCIDQAFQPRLPKE
jgi:hypothetical protein